MAEPEGELEVEGSRSKSSISRKKLQSVRALAIKKVRAASSCNAKNILYSPELATPLFGFSKAVPHPPSTVNYSA